MHKKSKSMGRVLEEEEDDDVVADDRIFARLCLDHGWHDTAMLWQMVPKGAWSDSNCLNFASSTSIKIPFQRGDDIDDDSPLSYPSPSQFPF